MTRVGRARLGADPTGLPLSAELLLQHSGRALAQLYRGGPEQVMERGDGWWLVLSGSREAAHNWVVVTDPAAAWLIPDLAAHVQLIGVPAMLAVTQEVMVAAGEALHRVSLDLAVAAPHLGASLDDLDLAPVVAGDRGAALGGTTHSPGPMIDHPHDEAGLAAAVDILVAAFDFDRAALAAVVTPVVLFGTPIRITTATVDGQVVAAALLWTADAITYVCFAGTIPSAQRRGHGRAVLIAALRRERERGARTVHLVASADGEPLYRRLGMREIGLGPLLLHAIPVPVGPALGPVSRPHVTTA